MSRWNWFRLLCVYGIFWLAVAGSVYAGPSGKEKRLIRALSDSSFKVRLQAAILAGKNKLNGVVPALREALEDKHVAVRAAAIVSLGKMGDEDSRPNIAKLLGNESRLIGRAAEKGLMLLDKTMGQTPVYLVAVTKPKLPKGVDPSRGHRLIRVFSEKLQKAGGVVLSAGEEKILKGKELTSHLRKRKLGGIRFEPKLSSLRLEVDEDRTIVYGVVNVLVTTLPEKRLEFSGGGEANAWIEDTEVEEEDRIDLENSVLDSSAEAAVMQALEYLANRSNY